VYLAKLLETAVHSSWMVILLAVPIFTAYGLVFDGGILFPFVVTGALVPLLLIPAVVGAALTLLLVNVFPARRTRDLLGLIAIGAAGGLVLLLRFVRPELLVRPEGFQNLMDFIALLEAPTNPFLPSEWSGQMVMNWLLRISDPLPIVLLWTTSGAFIVFGAAFHSRWYAQGFTRAQEGAGQTARSRRWDRVGALLGVFPPSRRELLLKDMRLFFRDSTQWSQLILLGVLVVVYLFNITALPLFTGERVPFFLVTMVAFLNMGLAGFVLAAIAARFIFPSFSLEGRQMWLLRSTPLDLRALLWSKYWIGTIPLLVLALIIIVLTNTLLRVSPFMMAVSAGTTIFLTFALCALAMMFGVLFPQFESENAAQIPTSFGGLLLMMSAIGLLAIVIGIEARPVLMFLRARRADADLVFSGTLLSSLGAVVLVCLTATFLPMRLALRRMERMEF
ncbi:MAG: putative ABC transporter permease subunit, partial [Gemmatimonadales bacterium]